MKANYGVVCALVLLGGFSAAVADEVNFLLNPDFESASCTDNGGQWGWFKNGLVSVANWTGGGNAGLSVNGCEVWLPAYSTGSWTVFIQMQGDQDDSGYIEQTVRVPSDGRYVFSFMYATRGIGGVYSGGGEIGFSVNDGQTTVEYPTTVFVQGDFNFHRARYELTLSAGTDYTFRIHGVAGVASDHTAIIADCALTGGSVRTYKLEKDEDWTVDAIEPEDGMVIDLNGHRLTLGVGFAEGNVALQFQDSSQGDPGELHFAVPEGGRATSWSGCRVSGNLKVVKRGPGLFAWTGGTIDGDVPILITNGVFRMEVSGVNAFGNHGDVFVSGQGQFDVNFGNSSGASAPSVLSPVYGRHFYIEGDGPDGSGAVVNTISGVRYGACHFGLVTLTGDATIGGSSRIDFRGNGPGVEGQDHALTVKNTDVLSFCGGTAFLKVRCLVIRDGGVCTPCADGCVIEIAEPVLLEDGGKYSAWGGLAFSEDISVVVGQGGGRIGCDTEWIHLKGLVTVNDGCVLDTLGVGVYYGALSNGTGSVINHAEGGAWARNIGPYDNFGSVNHSAGELCFGYTLGNEVFSCDLANHGTITTSGGTFLVHERCTVTGSGTLEVDGGAATLAGDFSGFGGVIRLAGGEVAFDSLSTFQGTLVLADGVITTDLSDFTGSVVMDVSGRDTPLEFDGRGWDTLPQGSLIQIRAAGRRIKPDVPVIGWTARPAGIDGWKFKSDAGGVVVGEDGIYIRRGTMVLVF